MSKIETHRSSVPWSWVGWMTFPWVALYYIENVSGNGPLTFTIRKFVDNPVLIGFLSSLNVAFNFLVGVAANYMSDRIWTRWGRRKPFLIVGWTGVAVALLCLPLARNVWVLAVVVVLLQFSADIAKTVEPLYNEVIPSSQRGRAGSARNIAQHLMGLVFFGVLLVQFDRVYDFSILGRPIHLSGEAVLYWTGSALLISVVLFLMCRVRETPPPEEKTVERVTLRKFFHEVFGKRQWWLVYLLYVTPMIASPGDGSFNMLVRTDQLGFTKAQLGYAISFGLLITILVVAPLVGYLADHMSRMRLLRIGLVGPAITELLFFLHLRFVAHYSISLPTLILFGLLGSAFATCLFVVWGPLVFDYIPSARLGTVSAGLTFVGGLVPFLTINLGGLWITGFTKVFGRAGGGRFDYSSIYVLQFGCALLALAATFYFEREERRGRVRPLGRGEPRLTS